MPVNALALKLRSSLKKETMTPKQQRLAGHLLLYSADLIKRYYIHTTLPIALASLLGDYKIKNYQAFEDMGNALLKDSEEPDGAGCECKDCQERRTREAAKAATFFCDENCAFCEHYGKCPKPVS